MYPATHRPWRLPAALAFTYLFATPALALTPVHLSSVHYGGTSADGARAVAVAPTGDLIVAGEFTGSIDLGGGALTAGGSTDIFLACYSASGAYKWARAFGGTASEYAFSVAVDSDGYILLTGYYVGLGYFGGTNLSSSSWDLFVARYASDGAHQWSHRYGGTSIDRGNAIAADADGNVYVTGYFNNTIDFGGGPMVSAGSNDMFLVKLGADGVHQWSRQFGSTGIDVGNTLAVDASGNVWASGSFYGTVDFGGGGLTSNGGSDVLLIQYDTDGAYQWAGTFGGTGSDQGTALAVAPNGDVVLAGYFSDSVDFGGGELNSDGQKDVFVARFDNTGNHQWSVRGGGTANDEPGALCVDVLDRISVTGWFRGNADFGGGTVTAAGLDDVFLAVYDGTGAYQWDRRAGGISSDFGYGIATNNDTGSIYDVGAFSLTANFGGDDLTSNGDSDAFVAKYAHAAEPIISSVMDVPNDQGLRVRITFRGSGLDAPESTTPVASYIAFRRNDPPPASNPSRYHAGHQEQDAGWTPVASIHAHGFAEYSIDAPTVADSTTEYGVFHSVFFVRAVTVDTLTFYDSPPDSGYSVDNLVPGVPGSLLYASGVLSWTAPTNVPDLHHFTVYGSDAGTFGGATIIATTPSNSMDVSASPFVFYFVTASDDAGNESTPAQATTLTGPGTTPSEFVLGVSNYPNPFNPRTTVRYTVPARGRVTVAVYDARGARVTTLIPDTLHEAGAYTVEWGGRADNGAAVASGVYLLRIQHNGAARSSKIIVLK